MAARKQLVLSMNDGFRIDTYSNSAGRTVTWTCTVCGGWVRSTCRPTDVRLRFLAARHRESCQVAARPVEACADTRCVDCVA